MIELSEALRDDMVKKGIDLPLSLEILENFNKGLYDGVKPILARGVPSIDGQRVVDLRNVEAADAVIFSFDARNAERNLALFGIGLPASARTRPDESGHGSVADFNAGMLRKIGLSLFSSTAYGVLNGGSATSYADSKKNLALGSGVFEALSAAFRTISPLCDDRPKGITPAYVNPDSSPGASFLELKMRARLLLAAEALADAGVEAGLGVEAGADGDAGTKTPLKSSREILPLFQMTSTASDAVLAGFYAKASCSNFLAPLASRLGIDPTLWRTGVQPMISAFTHSSEGRPKRIFDKAYGQPDSALPLPGGHGQCFRALAQVFRDLREKGIRYACLGNVDNIGYTPDPVELAIMAISRQPAAFDFAARTPMDVKGGILVETAEGKRTVADIGPAIALEQVLELERKGFPILFNCASGIFDLEYILPRIDEIAKKLPVRFSDQDKDGGKYSQAEQVTWEVTGVLPSFIAFAVNKNKRFLAAKLLVETLLTSGVGSEDPRIPAAVKETACSLHDGLTAILEGLYGLKLAGGRWIPRESA